MSGTLVEQVRRLRTWAGVLDGHRVCASTWESTDVRPCKPSECRVRAFTSDLLVLPAKEEESIWLSGLVFYVTPVCRCC